MAANLITTDQCEQALHAQILWGGRLGTSLIELGLVSLDDLSKVLGRQRRHPAALAQHFDLADRAVQARLSSDVAERFSCIPLLRVGHNKVVIASVAPLDEAARSIVAGELGIDPAGLLSSIAAELRIRYYLEKIYRIQRPTRFLRSRGDVTAFPRFEILPVVDNEPDLEMPGGPSTGLIDVLSSAEVAIAAAPTRDLRGSIPPISTRPTRPMIPSPGLVPLPAPRDTRARRDVTPPDQAPATTETVPELEHGRITVASLGRAPTVLDRRTYVPSLGEPPVDPAPLAKVSVKRLAIGTDAMLPLARGTDAPTGSTLGEAMRAIRRSTDRDKVAQLVMYTVARFVPETKAAILLVVRGGLAIGWAGFSRMQDSLPEVAVPMDVASLVPATIRRNKATRASASDVGPIDFLLLETMGMEHGDLVVVPITVADQVVCVIAMATEPDSSVSSSDSIAAAAGAALARLMRDASR